MGKTIEINETDLDSRAKAVADAIAQAAEEAAERATVAWRESQPVRRDAAKAIEKQGREIGKWSRKTWRQDIRPGLRRLWTRRTVAIGAAGAAVPAMIEDAAAELGLRPKNERHWGAFLLGILIGAADRRGDRHADRPQAGRGDARGARRAGPRRGRGRRRVDPGQRAVDQRQRRDADAPDAAEVETEKG